MHCILWILLCIVFHVSYLILYQNEFETFLKPIAHIWQKGTETITFNLFHTDGWNIFYALYYYALYSMQYIFDEQYKTVLTNIFIIFIIYL